MVYHSAFNDVQGVQLACNMSVLPLKTKHKGPAPPARNAAEPDVIDEALDYFKANVLYRNYDVQGPADRVLIYLTYYIKYALTKIEKLNKADAEKALILLAGENFQIPGDAGFPFGGFFPNPANRQEAELIRNYFSQLRLEVGGRLCGLVYAYDPNVASKWWLCFNKRKFLNLV